MSGAATMAAVNAHRRDVRRNAYHALCAGGADLYWRFLEVTGEEVCRAAVEVEGDEVEGAYRLGVSRNTLRRYLGKPERRLRP